MDTLQGNTVHFLKSRTIYHQSFQEDEGIKKQVEQTYNIIFVVQNHQSQCFSSAVRFQKKISEFIRKLTANERKEKRKKNDEKISKILDQNFGIYPKVDRERKKRKKKEKLL